MINYKYKTVDENAQIVMRDLQLHLDTYICLSIALRQTNNIIINVYDSNGNEIQGYWTQRTQMQSEVLNGIIVNLNMEHDEPSVSINHKLRVIENYPIQLTFTKVGNIYVFNSRPDGNYQSLFVEFILEALYFGHTCYIVDAMLEEYVVSDYKIKDINGFEIDSSLVLYRPIYLII